MAGGALPLLLGAALGSATTTASADTWAAPMPPGAFLALSLGLAVSHLLVLLAYTSARRSTSGVASAAALVGAVGTAALVACEVWSGTLARTPLHAPVLGALDAAYGVSSLAVLVGTLVLAVVLLRSRPRLPLAWPVLVNGLALLVAIPLKFFTSDGVGVAALTVWSLTYVWWGLRMRKASRRHALPEAMDARTA
ncbi:hypothetical protein [Quadrisphaera granulorum]|uniref:hypothetical protein n=1 Tax=Quadrisphaera granulorum TaxID=317664 RepID=UPI0011B85815|nr:hypothetical protein [Quadrisphaera granulorum]